jgi:ferrous iron transport protein A
MAANEDSNHRRNGNRQGTGWGVAFFGQTPETPRNEDNLVAFFQKSAHSKFEAGTYLRNLAVGGKGRIVGYERVTGGYKGRLLAMGLTPGTEFTVIRHAPLGDLEIEVGGFKVSLRRHEANVLCIEEVDELE